jgi:hypothetical protein
VKLKQHRLQQSLMRQSNHNIEYSENPSPTRGIFYLKVFVILLLLGFALDTNAQAKIKFTSETKKDLGKVKKGDVVSADYEFINEGNEPLIISSYEVECSCTTVDFPKQPVAPGQSGKLTVKFDTKSAYDRQDRKVVIVSNAKNSASVRIKCFVIK